MIVVTQVPVVANIGPQASDGSFIALDLRLIFANLDFGRTSMAIQRQPVPVLLELPLTTLEFALVGLEIKSAASLR